MAQVFISYARGDRQLAELLATDLEQKGYSVWWDVRLQAGEVFDEIILAELGAAAAVIVIWTTTSVKSEYVRSEARRGRSARKLIPTRVPDLDLALVYPPFDNDNIVLVGDRPRILQAMDRLAIKADQSVLSNKPIPVAPPTEAPSSGISHRTAPAQAAKVSHEEAAIRLNEASAGAAAKKICKELDSDYDLKDTQKVFQSLNRKVNGLTHRDDVPTALFYFYVMQRQAEKFARRSDRHIRALNSFATSRDAKANPGARIEVIRRAEECASRIEEQAYALKIIDSWLSLRSPSLARRLAAQARSFWYRPSNLDRSF